MREQLSGKIRHETHLIENTKQVKDNSNLQHGTEEAF
jgi:hypothetical protein